MSPDDNWEAQEVEKYLRHKQVVQIDHVATGDEIRKYREWLGLSLRSAAKLLKLSAPYLSDLELGRRNWSAGLVLDVITVWKRSVK